MDRLRKQRAPLRASFTRTANEIRGELAAEPVDLRIVNIKFGKLDFLIGEMHQLDLKMKTAMLDADVSDEDYEAEVLKTEEYEDTMRDIGSLVEDLQPPKKATPEPREAPNEAYNNNKKSYKLPKIQLKKFNGELTEWIGFWSQFVKIHEDEDLHASDKFQYLVQTMEKGTRAAQLVDSYPQSEENYPKVINALKERFGKDDLLVEVYVRELLKLVIWNASERKDKVSIAVLYDKIEAHLRALETMGVTSAKNTAMLYPLVESSLPEEMLRAWQRSSLSSAGEEAGRPKKSRLERLMEFLKSEVEGDERISLARAGFGVPTKSSKLDRNRSRREDDEEELPTAAGLLNGESDKCLFCEKPHESRDCFKAQTMTLQKKKEMVQGKKRCFQCFRSGHISRNCKVAVRCIACGGKHQTLLCSELATQQKEDKSRTQRNTGEVSNSMAALTCTKSVILQTLMVKIFDGKGEKLVRAIIDTGSQKTYLLEKIAKELGIKSVESEVLSHALFGGLTSEQKSHRKFQLKVGHPSGSFKCSVEVLESQKICGGIPRMETGLWLQELKKKGIWLSDLGADCPEIQMLVGADVVGRLLTGKIHQLRNGLTAVETRLGWTIMGRVTSESSRTTSAMMVTSTLLSEASICELWKLETIGIMDPTERLTQEEQDEVTRQQFLRNVSQGEDGRYCVSLPWIEGHPPLPNNKDVAVKRLWNATTKLIKTDNFSRYEAVFEEWLEMGVIEEVPDDEDVPLCHYLPHHAVIKEESRTTKCRPVFNASSKSKNSPSLNECLQKGPTAIEMINAILLRFREKKIGVIADIRKAFLMIDIIERDRDYLRFLWWEDYEKKKMKTYRHCRVLFGLNCSPFLLAAVIQLHLSKVSEDKKELVKKLLECLFVDNVISSVDTQEELQSFVKDSTALFAEAQLDLRMWEDSIGLNGSDTDISPVLGIKWNKLEDNMYVDISARKQVPAEITKRSILSMAQKIFDPVGLLSPVLLVPKLILQESWLQKIGWDDEVPQELKKRFFSWLEDLGACEKVKVLRHLSIGFRRNFSLHVFCDASKHAYASVIFLRSEDGGKVQVRFVESKSRVAPVKSMTIPRLELLSCVVGVRLCDSVKKTLKYEDVRTIYWSDSSTAIAWIRRNDQWGTFVGNRTKEIRKKTSPSQWRHVPGILNPADLPSRGCSGSQLAQSSWWEGPKWLFKSEEGWPRGSQDIDEDAVNQEMKKCTTSVLTSTKEEKKWFERISSYSKIVRVAVWIRRFVDWKFTKKVPTSKSITAEEWNKAEKGILREVQKKLNSTTHGLKVSEDECGLLRIKSKLLYREDNELFRSPILLPSKHHVVDALVREVHLKNCHGGTQFLMSKLREKFWIVKSRRSIKNIIGRCVPCRRYEAKKIETIGAPLPKDRVKEAGVFEVTGIDLAGPLYLKNKEKCWIVLFTCGVFRAVHLELVSSLSTEGFIQTLRRFVARRGRPKVVYSDNGTNFHGTENSLRELDWKKIQEEFGVEAIEWKFIPPSAAWWGGFWERLIRSTKSLLVRILGRSTVSYEELATVLCDVESTLNDRPLTYVSEEGEDLVPLTPSMFLRDLKTSGTPDLDSVDRDGLEKRLRYRQKLRDEFRSRFRKEYLGQLVQRGKEKESTGVRVGDIVLVGADNKKRIDWPIARVMEVLPGRDGKVRVVKVKTSTGILTRPIQRLYQLEVSDRGDVPGGSKDSSEG